MSRTLRQQLWSLVKPRIVTLLCVTGLFSLFAAGGGSVKTVLAFVVAGGCIAASAAAFNCWYDRNLDEHMDRTATRPLPSGELDHRVAAAFATVLLLAGSTIGLLTLPVDTVVYMWLGFGSYVGLYTVLLKRRHWLGVVLGGSAGSFPVLAGWTAVQPITPEALLMASVVFAWTPGHAWALAYVYRTDFAAADVPTLPVVVSERRVRRAVWVSAITTVVVAIGTIPFAAPPYAVTTIVASGFLLLGFHQFYRSGTEPAAVRAFFTSNLYLAVLFLAWGLGGVLSGLSPVFQVLAVVGVPVLFVQLWRAQPALRGVPGATGGEWKFVTDPVREKLRIERWSPASE